MDLTWRYARTAACLGWQQSEPDALLHHIFSFIFFTASTLDETTIYPRKDSCAVNPLIHPFSPPCWEAPHRCTGTIWAQGTQRARTEHKKSRRLSFSCNFFLPFFFFCPVTLLLSFFFFFFSFLPFFSSCCLLAPFTP